MLQHLFYNHKKEPSERQMKQQSGHYNYIVMQLYMI